MPKKYFSSNLFKFFTIVAVCGFLVFWNPENLFNPVRWVLLRITYPLQKTFYLLSQETAETVGFFSSISGLKEENEKLIQENNLLAGMVAMLENERKDNENLREQLRLAPREKFNLEAASVIAQNSQKPGGWLLIDKGSSDGIKPEMPVIAYEGILVGRVAEVFSGTSKILLLSDSESVVNTFDLETGARGIIRGEYGLGLIMDMVSQSETLNAGDTIVTSGLGSGMPKGLLIGKIQEIRMTGDKLFQQAVVFPRIRYAKLETVFVIKNPIQK